jgi:hypothetical protein
VKHKLSYKDCLLGFKGYENIFNFLDLIYNIQKCLSVWTFIGSVPGPDTVMRPVSLEPVWPGGGPLRDNFPEKWPVAKLPNKMLRHWAFQWGFFCPVHYERGALSSNYIFLWWRIFCAKNYSVVQWLFFEQ